MVMNALRPTTGRFSRPIPDLREIEGRLESQRPKFPVSVDRTMGQEYRRNDHADIKVNHSLQIKRGHYLVSEYPGQ